MTTEDRGSWVIHRKIVAPLLADSVVPRRRVETLLTSLIDQHRLVFVYASAGAGKTTAVLQAAQRLQRRLVWLDLDTTDTATGRLLVYLEAALGLQVPRAVGVASSALAAQIPHAEVAGLLAQAVGNENVVVVLDNAERLAGAPEALDVVAALARYLPRSACLVIASRTELPFASTVGDSPWVAAVGEEDLALTVDEAKAVLAALGRDDVDPVDAIVETGGWMTGVLLEAWTARDHVIGLGGEADPLHGYLATEILGQLGAADSGFLVRTAVLSEVTVTSAEALGVAGARERLRSLAGRRLPVGWHRAGTVLRCHPRFREFLLRRLTRLPEEEQRGLHRAHARLLLAEGHDEEAVEAYLEADLPDEALQIVHPVLERVIERTDFALAERWLAALASVRPDDDLLLASAELMLAVVRERFSVGVELADRLQGSGTRLELARSSGRAAGLMAWCYLHAGRAADMDAVLAAADPEPESDAARYALAMVRDEPEFVDDPRSGRLSGGPMDALVLRTHFDLGRLPLLAVAPSSPWAAKAAESWLVSALLANGYTEQAFELFQRLADSTDQSVWLSALLGPRLMSEVGDREEAWRLLREGRERIRATGSILFDGYRLLLEAEFELRLNGDPAAALTLLRSLPAHLAAGRYAFLAEQGRMLTGLTLLSQNRDDEAVLHLRHAVEGMRRGQRLLYLVTAAVYLSEAEWRTGHEQASDEAADLARAAAARQGSSHYLLKALADFPDVLARRLDLESGADSDWHALGRGLMVRAAAPPPALPAQVEVAEFGRAAITFSGTEVSPGLNKSIELLALLADGDADEVPRGALLDALFAGQRTPSSAAYLRQAVLKLRRVLPDVLDTDTTPGTVRLSAGARVSTESRRFVGLLTEASGARGPERLRLLLAALELADRGPYLPSVSSRWVEERRQHLEELVRSARIEAAEVAFTEGQYAQATGLAEAVVRVDPYREAGWRLLMRIAQTHGDTDRVTSAYRSCERALHELGAEPSATTAKLLRDSRR